MTPPASADSRPSPAPARPTGGSTLDRDATIALMSAIVIIGFVTAVAYHYVFSLYGGSLVPNVQLAEPGRPSPKTFPFVYFGRQYPANTFLFRPWDMFNDFANIYPLLAHPEAVAGQPFRWNHFPFAFVALMPFYYLLPSWLGIICRLLLIILPFFAISRLHLKGTTPYDTLRNVFVFSALTYPFLFACDRANNEVDIFFLLAGFVYALKCGRHRLSVIPLAIAVAMKPYATAFLPLLFLHSLAGRDPIVILRKQGLLASLNVTLKACVEPAAVLGIAAVLNLVSIAILHACVGYKPTILAEAWKQTMQVYVVGDEGLPFGNSLWGAAKVCFSLLTRDGTPPTLRAADAYRDLVVAALPVYRSAVLLAFAGILLFIWKCERVFWKQITLFVCALNLFPYVSGDYKLLHLFVPLWLFVNREQHDPYDTAYATLFALLLVPQNYFRFPMTAMEEVNLGVVVHPLLMLTLLGLIIVTGVSRHARAAGGSPHLSPSPG